MEISLEAGDPMRNALLKIVYTIKTIEPLPPQVTLADKLALPRVE